MTKPRLLLCAALWVVALTQPVSATNVAPGGGTAGVFRANNAYHWFAYSPTFGPDDVNAVEYVRTGDFETTTLVTSNHGIGVSDSNNWDVYAEKCPSSCMIVSTWDGQVDCRVTVLVGGETRCSHYHLRFNVDYTANYSVGTLRMLACHEVGHTVGLTHPPATWLQDIQRCMEQDTSDRIHWSLGDHNRPHINNLYTP